MSNPDKASEVHENDMINSRGVVIDSWRVVMTTTEGREKYLRYDIPDYVCTSIDELIKEYYETTF